MIELINADKTAEYLKRSEKTVTTPDKKVSDKEIII